MPWAGRGRTPQRCPRTRQPNTWLPGREPPPGTRSGRRGEKSVAPPRRSSLPASGARETSWTDRVYSCLYPPFKREGGPLKIPSMSESGTETDDGGPQASVPLQEMQVAGFAGSRLRADNFDEGLLFVSLPAREVRDQAEHEGESREGFPLLAAPAPRIDSERAGDARLGGAADLLRAAAELPSHAAGDSEGNVADVEGIPGEL